MELELIDAVKSGDTAEAARLLKIGANVNQQDGQGWTPLAFAAGKGDLGLVELLVENGADIFKTGRDGRTAYTIALAAGRVSVVKYLRELEDQYSGKNPAGRQRPYCKAYHLAELRKYPGWSENRITRKSDNRHSDEESDMSGGEKVVFVHQDLIVTESMRHDENVIFRNGDSSWEDFCANTLRFTIPDDLDLIVPNGSVAADSSETTVRGTNGTAG